MEMLETVRGNFHLSREERDYVAGHALGWIHREANNLSALTIKGPGNPLGGACSDAAHKIAALSELLGDIGWEREGEKPSTYFSQHGWNLGELFPTAQLRPWLEEWVVRDTEALCEAEQILEATRAREAETGGREHRKRDQETAVEQAQDKLGTGGLLLVRLEKWVASHGN